MALPTPIRRPSGPARPLLTLLRTLLGVLSLCGALVQAQNAGPSAVRASAQADNVAIITIRSEIDTYTAVSVRRRMELAEKGGAQALVFELDTPGGDVSAMLDICDAIKQSPISNTVAWVNTKAYSAGAVIALACKEVITNDPAALGDALPITGANGFGVFGALPEAERQKFAGPIIAELVDSARRSGYDEKLVQGIASRGVELWLVQNKADPSKRLFIGPEEYRLIFGAEPDRSMVPAIVSSVPHEAPGEETIVTDSGAASPPQSKDESAPSDKTAFIPASPGLAERDVSKDVNLNLERASSRPILTSDDLNKWDLVEYVSTGHGLILLKAPMLQRYGLSHATVTNDQELSAYFGAKNLSRIEPSWSERFTVFLTLIPVKAVLIVIFLIGMFLEMTHPGLILPGAFAGAALIALLAPPLVVGMANWWEVAAVLIGIALIALEVFVIPGFGITGVAGLILLFGGLVGTFVHQTPGSLFPNTAQARSDLLYGVVSIILALGTSSIAIYYLGKHFGSLPLLGNLVLKAPGSADDDSDDFLSAMGPESALPVSVGDIGIAVTPIRPVGRIQIDDRIIDVVSEMAYIRAGERVRIVSAAEFRIVVEPAGPPAGPEDAGPPGADPIAQDGQDGGRTT